MRPLHIGKFYPPVPGGMENFLYDLLHELVQQQIECAAVVHVPLEYAGSKSCATRIGLPKIRLFKSRSYGTLLYAPVSPSFPLVLDRAIREFKPDVLHVHMPNTSAFWLLASVRARRIPWVIHWHSDVVQSQHDKRLKWAYQFYKLLEARMLAKAQVIFATSQAYLDASQALMPWRNKCKVVPLGIDPKRQPEPGATSRDWAASQWNNAEYKILSVGRLTYYKGHETLIRAMEHISGGKLILVGDGECKEKLTSLVTSLGLTEKVMLTGYRADEEVKALLESCDVFCLPSIERTEAFGIVLLEAMQVGKPAVASDVPGSGVGWVVNHEKTGLLVAPSDVGALGGALLRLKSDNALRKSMGEAAKKRFESEFQIRQGANGIIMSYQSLGKRSN